MNTYSSNADQRRKAQKTTLKARRCSVFLVLMLCLAGTAYAQDEGLLEINSASESKLVGSGLFSPYQAASLKDYISRCGPIYSYMELALVDGFSSETVSYLIPYISLEAPHLWEGKSGAKAFNTISTRLATTTSTPFSSFVKYKGGYGEILRYGAAISAYNSSKWIWDGLEDRADIDKFLSATDFSGGFCVSYTPLQTIEPISGTHPFNIDNGTLGSLNCRFGQGLLVWTGTSISSLPKARYAGKNPTGICPYFGSSANCLMGAGGTASLGGFALSAAACLPDVWEDFSKMLFCADLSYKGRWITASITGLLKCGFKSLPPIEASGVSVSLKSCIKGCDIFTETAFDCLNGEIAFIGGVSFRASESIYLSLLARKYPENWCCEYSGAIHSFSQCSNEHAVTLIADIGYNGGISADFCYCPKAKWNDVIANGSFQTKIKGQYEFLLFDGALSLRPKLSYRLRTGGEFHRSDAQMLVRWSPPSWNGFLLSAFACWDGVSTRSNEFFQKQNSGAGAYLEPGYKSKWLGIYCCVGIYRADNWAGRIYIYRRDVSGSFNNGALYGKGLWSCIFADARFARRYQLSVHLSGVFPFDSSIKGSSFSLAGKLQFAVDF